MLDLFIYVAETDAPGSPPLAAVMLGLPDVIAPRFLMRGLQNYIAVYLDYSTRKQT